MQTEPQTTLLDSELLFGPVPQQQASQQPRDQQQQPMAENPRIDSKQGEESDFDRTSESQKIGYRVVWDLIVKKQPKFKATNPTKDEWIKLIEELGDALPFKEISKLNAVLS
jgi:hypothetical protein